MLIPEPPIRKRVQRKKTVLQFQVIQVACGGDVRNMDQLIPDMLAAFVCKQGPLDEIIALVQYVPVPAYRSLNFTGEAADGVYTY
ncbi:hypothetical protein NDU88_005654 [Pleurodeles waltl]|uniref:Uncharacterized protein n=1 Tax=Pleurodeles waltl TaxID=8319 RepID=A0AAV7PG06_PLEWA|nr:hypothetical protein NDU88_005654 [Pleurodeles waltl]